MVIFIFFLSIFFFRFKDFASEVRGNMDVDRWVDVHLDADNYADSNMMMMLCF